MNARSLVVRGLAVAVSLVWVSSAQAHPGYPPVVDKSLSLTKPVHTMFPPSGCQLCHQSAGGGDQLKEFGSLLVSTYGLSSDPGTEHDSSLEQAFIGLAASDSAAVKDLQNGVDPNSDPTVFAAAVPTPEYGCAVKRSSTRDPLRTLSFVSLAVFLGVIRRRSRGQKLARSSAPPPPAKTEGESVTPT